jgi:primosomal protein N' (replication factor Y)
VERKTFFVDVLLPLPVKGLFTYRVPFALNEEVAPYKRVIIQFGKKKVYTAVIIRVHEEVPRYKEVKYILSVLDKREVLLKSQYRLWQWMAHYYLSTEGEIMNAALPTALKLSSETRIVLHPDFEGDYTSLNEKEFLIAEALELQQKLTINEVSAIIELKQVHPILNNLYEKKVILYEEELQERYRPKTAIYVRLSQDYLDERKLKDLFDILEKKSVRQLEVLMYFLRLAGSNIEASIKRSEISSHIKNSNPAILSMAKKGIFVLEEKIVSRLKTYTKTTDVDSIRLTEEQSQALEKIQKYWETKDTVLLHGVTSSGKTEVYIKVIDKAMKRHKQVLLLLPEIALTTQIINRLKEYFGAMAGVYHSRYSNEERIEIWQKMLSRQPYQLIIGPRSALFLPYQDLGVVIVDEEHDTSYKQHFPPPFYQARDVAVVLAAQHQAKVLLGSATPSLETYFNTEQGKYARVEMTKRYGDVMMPEIWVADLRFETRKKLMKSHFSSLLMEHIDQALKNNEQIILFQNRRGFSLRLECNVCNWVPQCKSCDVTLTYHKSTNQLKCHYCGYARPVPATCDSCGSNNLKMHGFGTEKIEDDLALYFPDASIKRMDLDTTRSKYSYQSILQDFDEKKIDILVGTQMVTKGLDFGNVSVVGVLNADSLLFFPEFRAFERAYQMLAQVAGRAGRKEKRGKVIIQTFNPYHDAIRYVMENDYRSMYFSQLNDRKKFRYPPYFRLIHLQILHKDFRVLNPAAASLGRILKAVFGDLILGPEYPFVSRIRNMYIKQIMVKIPRNKKLDEFKDVLQKQIDLFFSQGEFKGVRVILDVDPL